MPSQTAPEAPAAFVSQRDRLATLFGRAVPASQWLLVLALAAYIGGRALPRAWNHLNTDFPNYYITARLLREGYGTDRIYEWIWLQRQKDRMGISRSDQPVVGFEPDTPFSSLVMWPLASRPPLSAKHLWIICNLLLLLAVAALLRSLTELPWRVIALLIGLNYPVLRNFEYGQYYLLVLFLITAGLWLYVRNARFLSSVLVGLACGLKIFPGLFLFYFARKRDVRGALGLTIGALASVVASIWAFGWQLHRTYFLQILPWALRGEALDPYNLVSNSISSLLHKLLLYDPEWNPHPVTHAPMAFAVLHPLLQMLVLAPAIYLALPHGNGGKRTQLEWSTFIVALLAISTLPASYHFTLLILPVAVFTSYYLRNHRFSSLAFLLFLYVAICFPAWPHTFTAGWWALLSVPRLYLVLLLCLLCYSTLLREREIASEYRIDLRLWATALVILLMVQVVSTWRHQRDMHLDYANRIVGSPEVFLATQPIPSGDQTRFIAMRSDGYFAGSVNALGVQLDSALTDQLSHAVSGQTTWIEEAGAPPRIIRRLADGPPSVAVNNAEFPVVSSDGQWMAYLRSTKGRSALWERALFDPGRPDVMITPLQFDVAEMTFLPGGSLIFAATQNGGPSSLYLASGGEIRPLAVGNARYPAASPDGRLLAYSKLDHGVWNLWLKDLSSGASRPLISADCNIVSPAWDADSRTLLYASDCGRALWLTALYRQRVVP